MRTENNPSDCSREIWRWDVALLLIVCLVVLWLGLGTTRLWDQDEGYYASVAREMYARRDWVVPTFNQELFAHKPPMMFWGMIAGFEIFGVGEFAARLFSAVFGTGMVLLTYRLGRLLADRTTALIGSLVLASSLMFSIVARSATADVHLGFFILLAITLWVESATKTLDVGKPMASDYPVTGLGVWLGIYLAIALAVLSKGPIGFAFPVAILGTLTLVWPWLLGNKVDLGITSLLQRFIRATISMRPMSGALVLLVIAAPWFLLVNAKTDGAFFAEFFGVQHLERFSKPMDNHSGPIYYYALATLIGFFPWTAFAIPIGLHAYQACRKGTHRLFWGVLMVWLFFYFAVFSLASTKLPNYIIPAYPAVALWIGSYFSGWLDPQMDLSNKRPMYWRLAGWSFILITGVLVSGFTVFLASEYGEPMVERLQIDPKIVPSVLYFSWLGVLLIASALGGILLLRIGKQRQSVSTMAILSGLWVVYIWQIVIPSIDRFQTPQQIAIEHIGPVDRQPAIVGMFRPSMVFYSRGALNFCQDDQSLQETLEHESPSLVVVNQSSDKVKQMLDQHGYRLADSVASFPKKGAIQVYRK